MRCPRPGTGSEGLGEQADPQLLDHPADAAQARGAARRPAAAGEQRRRTPADLLDLGHQRAVAAGVLGQPVQPALDRAQVAQQVGQPAPAGRGHEAGVHQRLELRPDVGQRRQQGQDWPSRAAALARRAHAASTRGDQADHVARPSAGQVGRDRVAQRREAVRVPGRPAGAATSASTARAAQSSSSAGTPPCGLRPAPASRRWSARQRPAGPATGQRQQQQPPGAGPHRRAPARPRLEHPHRDARRPRRPAPGSRAPRRPRPGLDDPRQRRRPVQAVSPAARRPGPRPRSPRAPSARAGAAARPGPCPRRPPGRPSIDPEGHPQVVRHLVELATRRAAIGDAGEPAQLARQRVEQRLRRRGRRAGAEHRPARGPAPGRSCGAAPWAATGSARSPAPRAARAPASRSRRRRPGSAARAARATVTPSAARARLELVGQRQLQVRRARHGVRVVASRRPRRAGVDQQLAGEGQQVRAARARAFFHHVSKCRAGHDVGRDPLRRRRRTASRRRPRCRAAGPGAPAPRPRRAAPGCRGRTGGGCRQSPSTSACRMNSSRDSSGSIRP